MTHAPQDGASRNPANENAPDSDVTDIEGNEIHTSEGTESTMNNTPEAIVDDLVEGREAAIFVPQRKDLIAIAKKKYKQEIDRRIALSTSLDAMMDANSVAALGLNPDEWDHADGSRAVRYKTLFRENGIGIEVTEYSDGAPSKVVAEADVERRLPTGDWSAHLRALSASALKAADLLDSLGDA